MIWCKTENKQIRVGWRLEVFEEKNCRLHDDEVIVALPLPLQHFISSLVGEFWVRPKLPWFRLKEYQFLFRKVSILRNKYLSQLGGILIVWYLPPSL